MIIVFLKKLKLIPIAWLILFSCIKAPNNSPPEIDWSNYTGYLSASEFKDAIIGIWKSVYIHKGSENVERLEVFPFGIARVFINDGLRVEVTGKYEIDFLRPPAEGNITIAEMTITSDNDQIVLSRMSFGYHNAVPMTVGILLRIDKSPYGVLAKIE